MPQTLLALAAVLIFSVFALSQHEAKADGEADAIRSEVEIAAAQLARERLADVLARRFDEADQAGGRVRVRPDGLSAIGADADDGATEADFDDVDDFHGRPARAQTMDWMGGTLAFTDSVSVRYVAYSGTALVASAAPTLMKEVTVTVWASPASAVGGSPVSATLSQIVTPTSD